MNWLLYAILGVLLVVMDASVMPVLRLGAIWPEAAPGLVAFVALWASRRSVPWAALLLGLLQDLSSPVVVGDREVIHLIGPATLGWLFGAAALLPLRRVLLRRHPIAVGAATVVLVLLANLVWGAIFSLRVLLHDEAAPWPPGGGVAALGTAALEAIADGVVAVPLAWMLMRLGDWWRFPGGGWTTVGSRGFQPRGR